MRVIHFERMSATGNVVPWCGLWGSTDTAWTDVADGVTCGPCRGAMRDDARPEGPRGEDAAARPS